MATVSGSLSPFMQPLGMLERTPLRLVSGAMQEPIVRHETPERSPLKLLKKKRASRET
jgi:hypothetical protein